MSQSYLAQWPRHYAADIIDLKTVEERREALSRVPENFRVWVAFYVKDYFQKRHFLRRAGRA